MSQTTEKIRAKARIALDLVEEEQGNLAVAVERLAEALLILCEEMEERGR
jgi:hypothetical protein